jgi:hypothetical protein
MVSRHPNPRLVKVHRNYSVEDMDDGLDIPDYLRRAPTDGNAV